MITVDNLKVEFSGRTLFSDISFVINENDKIALMGKNGAGKSTLLRLITGAYRVDNGVINKPKDVTLGFFNQDLLSFSTDDSILSVGMQAFERAHDIEKEMAAAA